MRLNKKILPLTVLLAVGIALTACGSSDTAASTPASSAVPASSHVAEEGVTEPINMLTWTLDDLDDTQTITFVSAAITSGVQDGKLTAKVFSCDIYKKEEIEKLAVGDKITFHEEGAAWNQFVTVAVKSIEKNDEYHLVSINGGMEQPGGLDLKLEDDVYQKQRSLEALRLQPLGRTTAVFSGIRFYTDHTENTRQTRTTQYSQ